MDQFLCHDSYFNIFLFALRCVQHLQGPAVSIVHFKSLLSLL